MNLVPTNLFSVGILTCPLKDKLPTLEGVSTSEVVASNLSAMHAARKQFVKCESLEKSRHALRHQIRTSITQSYKNGDVVIL